MAGTVGIYGSEMVSVGATTVGTSAVQITSTGTETNGALLRAHPDNTGVIYVGNSNAVTSATGFPLQAGETLQLDVADLSDIWAIASDADQDLRHIAARSR